jgi:hypothetical protein
MRMMVTENPKSGDTNKESPMSLAFDQLTASLVASGRRE